MKPSERIWELARARVASVGANADLADPEIEDILEYLDESSREAGRAGEGELTPAISKSETAQPATGDGARCECGHPAESHDADTPSWCRSAGCICARLRLAQPATADGTGEDELFTLANEICGPLGRHAHGPEHEAEMALITDRLQKARDLGRQDEWEERRKLIAHAGELEAQLTAAVELFTTNPEEYAGDPVAAIDQARRNITRERNELKEKLSAAETRAEKAESAREEAERKVQAAVAGLRAAQEAIKPDSVSAVEAGGMLCGAVDNALAILDPKEGAGP